jgi:MoaA/NifB/PqqE/SkfB family radical SAM enzyme
MERFRALRLPGEAGIPASFCTVATAMNAERIPEIIALMHDLGINTYRVQGMMPAGRGKDQHGPAQIVAIPD